MSDKKSKLFHFLDGNPVDSKPKTESNKISPAFPPIDREFSRYERNIANYLGYLAVTQTGFLQRCSSDEAEHCKYRLVSTTPLAKLIYWIIYVNTLIKAVFLSFLILDYFGPVVFLDKIAALDYILCVGIAGWGTKIWGTRYPLHEIIPGFWTIENSIFKSLGYPQELKKKDENQHWRSVWIHVAIVWAGCGCLVIQFYADPKYCGFTYSAFSWDTWWLRGIFCLHEFLFMMLSWNCMTWTNTLCSFKGASLANLLEGMSFSLKTTKIVPSSKKKVNTMETDLNNDVDKMITHYKQLILITDRFNEWIPYKVLALHMSAYFQLISDVFVAIQVLKLPGMGFMDVWFYLEDCCVGVYLIYRVYTFMSRVAPQSEEFLRSLRESIRLCNICNKKVYYRVLRTLKVVGLRLGPFVVTPMTVMTALQTFGDYYVCVALW